MSLAYIFILLQKTAHIRLFKHINFKLEMIKHLSEVVDKAKNKTTRKIVVAAAGDQHVLEAVQNAQKEGIIDPILVGDEKAIRSIAKKNSI